MLDHYYLPADREVTHVRLADSDLEGAADWLGNLGLRYQFRKGIMFDAHYRYVGERARDAGDRALTRRPAVFPRARIVSGALLTVRAASRAESVGRRLSSPEVR